jgi:hypothetical protein
MLTHLLSKQPIVHRDLRFLGFMCRWMPTSGLIIIRSCKVLSSFVSTLKYRQPTATLCLEMCFNYAHRKGKTTTCPDQLLFTATIPLASGFIHIWQHDKSISLPWASAAMVSFYDQLTLRLRPIRAVPPRMPGHVPIIRNFPVALLSKWAGEIDLCRSRRHQKTESRRPTQFVSICGTLRSCGLEILSAIASHVDTWRHQYVTLTGFQQTRTDSRLTSRVSVNKNFPLHKSSTWSQVNFTRSMFPYHITSNEMIYS